MAASKTSSGDISDTHTDFTKATTESDILSPPTTPPSSASSRPPSTLPEPDTEELTIIQDADVQTAAQKKKKKKKNKKSASAKAKAADNAKSAESPDEDRPPVLCISRNKHWRYISSYHGPWLQLPLELLESLLILNLDPATLSATESRLPPLPSPTLTGSQLTPRNRGFASVSDHHSADSPHGTFANLPTPPPLPAPKPGKATPPPIDPGVFRSVTHIRRLIDEASELSVRASSGLSAAALGSLRGGSGISRDPWSPQNILGTNGLNEGGGGRNIPMSATRIHRLRSLAVQKLAAAYKADEIASSVMVMQGGSVFDDIADRVLKVDPNDLDARYVHFFHEKIPSRQLAESTTTHQLDQLIAAQPHRLEFYRTRGIVHCFRDEYAMAAKDFTYAIRESRAQRKAKIAHRNNGLPSEQRGKSGKKKKGKTGGKTNGQAPPDGTSTPTTPDGPTIEGPDGEPLLLHPSVLPDAPDPIEPQCLFLRGAAYLQHAIYLIEETILKLEDIRKAPSVDGAELRLCYIENGRYGGVEIGNPDGPLGNKDGSKLAAYKEALANDSFRDHIHSLVKKALRDHEKFLSHFDTLEGIDEDDAGRNLAQQVELAYHLCENLRPNGQFPPPPLPDVPVMFTTYHPLLVESHFSVLICHLMLGDFTTLAPTFSRAALLVDGLEGYPVFLPPRSMSQAEYIEILERLAGGWKNGVQPHSLTRMAHLALTAPPLSPKAKDKEVDRTNASPIVIPISPTSSTSSDSQSANIGTTIETLLGVNGSSSSSAAQSSRTPSPPLDSDIPTPQEPQTPITSRSRGDLVIALDHARMILSPVAARQREKADRLAVEKANAKKTGKKKPLSINIPLHGPRVEIVLAWLGAVHLDELDTVA
ncbi:hypothetical protein EIP91_004143 [Steccherinum ochraceum]|uniref:Uncharacterized protein n=1 Tax=Steccherinum ochraceum TaxID=92696 RepID=A0A4R0RFJ8_9APHY|nr:hypothetical protein EIP91_004143 [Steccherinum ochraceum]